MQHKKRVIGFDLDGVLCDISLPDLAMLHEHDDEEVGLYYIDRKPLLNPKLFMLEEDEAVCVTARPKQFESITLTWMKKFYPDIPVMFFDNNVEWFDRPLVACEKVKILYRENVSVYFDDDPAIVRWMRGLSNAIQFIEYGGRL